MAKTHHAAPAEPQHQEQPQSGGRYERNADGTLTQIHKTEPAVGRTEATLAQRARVDADMAAQQPTQE